MSKKRVLTTLVVVLLLLSGLLVYRRHRPEPAGPSDSEDKPAPELTLNQSEEGELVKIVLSSAGEKLVLKYGEDGWQVEPAPLVSVDTYKLSSIVESFRSFQADRILLDTVEDLAEFGLATPRATAVLSFRDGTEKTFYLGDETPTGNGYYLMKEGDPRLYVVAYRYGGQFTATPTDLRERSLPEINTENLTLFLLKRSGAPAIEIKPVGPEGSPDGVTLGRWVMTKPYRRAYTVNDEKFSALLSKITSLRIDEFVHDRPADLGPYGLESPRAEVRIADGGNSLHLLFGATVDGKTYFKYADQPMVFAVNNVDRGFLTVKPDELIFRYACMVDIKKVDRIVVEGAGQTYDLRITREEAPAGEEEGAAGAGGEETAGPELVETFFVNGREVPEDAFRTFYQTLIGLSGEGEVQHQPAGTAEVRTSFYLNEGEEQPVIVSYVPYNQDFYAIVRDGLAEFAISRDQVARMLKELAALAQEN